MDARFVSNGRKYTHGVRTEKREHYATGESRELIAHLEAKFDQKDVTDLDLEVARKGLSFTGLPLDTETEERVSPRSALGVWDSRIARGEGMDEKDIALIIETLRKSERLGRDYVEVEIPKPKAPWAGYDKLDELDKALDILIATETDPLVAIAYEKANLGREDWLTAFHDLIDPDSADEKPVVINA